MSGAFLTTFGFVLVAEVVGDKLLYTTGVLATRHAATPIVYGVAAAFMAKMAMAVVLGAAIGALPRSVIAALTTASFLGVAYTLWRVPDRRSSTTIDTHSSHSKVALVSFAAIFFSEWGDAGQLAAATMAAQYRAPFIVWLGAVTAMVAKGVPATWVGAAVRNRIRDRVPGRAMRFAATGAVVLLGAFSVIEITLHRR
jgi:Ca2+/H+ antiporter, TMEM165/GDT1 family